ncbi:MAG: putative toxin-antitoxin system toxin component, PIN family [Tannerella sp.]|jgi:putative PIN family toxin of toxin-antitoxin system|nr:putative toxin-antitoxin system toxin component, PIN family [Tannerella sp.]
MPKIILDTNIVVSALLRRSYPHYIVRDVLGGNMELCLSKELRQEYSDVLARPKFARYPGFVQNAAILLNRLAGIAAFYEPSVRLELIRDASDNKLLELAAASGADFLVTGNTNDFTMSAYLRTRILSPREFYLRSL